jgi:hypothetical protein
MGRILLAVLLICSSVVFAETVPQKPQPAKQIPPSQRRYTIYPLGNGYAIMLDTYTGTSWRNVLCRPLPKDTGLLPEGAIANLSMCWIEMRNPD